MLGFTDQLSFQKCVFPVGGGWVDAENITKAALQQEKRARGKEWGGVPGLFSSHLQIRRALSQQLVLPALTPTTHTHPCYLSQLLPPPRMDSSQYLADSFMDGVGDGPKVTGLL